MSESIVISKNLVVPGNFGRPILVDFFRPSHGKKFPVVIFSHGFKGFKDWGPFNLIASQFAAKGFLFVKFNFSYNGTTPGNPEEFTDLEAFGNNNITIELDDLSEILNWIERNQEFVHADITDISVIGHSRGGGISILKASDDARIRKVAGWASLTGFDRHISRQEIIQWKKTGVHFVENSRTNQLMPLYLQLYEDFIRNHKRYNIRQAVKNLSKPLLLAHALNDDTIPFPMAWELASVNTRFTRLLSLQSGGHTFDASHPFDCPNLPNVFQNVVNQTIDFIRTA